MSEQNTVNAARREIFCQRSQALEKLPPTKNALLQHFKRAIYQAGIWTTCQVTHQTIPSPTTYGWKDSNNEWQPHWITIPEVSKACQELVKCACTGRCLHCKCAKAGLKCSMLCKCKCLNT